MEDNILNKPIGLKPLFSSFWKRHESFFKFTYGAAFYLSSIYGLFIWGRELIRTLIEGNFLGFILIFIAQSIILMITAILGSAIWGTFFTIVAIIPYLIIRGLAK